MIFYKENKKERQKKWHIWFAWYPICVKQTPDGDYKMVWLQNVYRCVYYQFDCYIFSYDKEYKYKEILK